MESLCRELQKQNRSMKQEMIQKSKTEEENRKALIDKFQGSLEEITKSLGIISSPPTQNWRMAYLLQLPLKTFFREEFGIQ